MIGMSINFNGDGSFADVPRGRLKHVVSMITVNVLEGGTASGRPSVALRLELPDGTVVCAETTARLFAMTGNALQARYPDLLKDDA